VRMLILCLALSCTAEVLLVGTAALRRHLWSH